VPGLVQRPTSYVEDPSLVGEMPAPRGLGDVRTNRIYCAKQLKPDLPPVKRRPRPDLSVEFVSDFRRESIGREVFVFAHPKVRAGTGNAAP